MQDGLIETATNGSGNGGQLTIEVERLEMKNGAQIASGSGSQISVGSGSGGDLGIIATESILLSGEGTTISSNSFGEGRAGNMLVSGPLLTIEDGGSIEATGDLDRGGGHRHRFY